MTTDLMSTAAVQKVYPLSIPKGTKLTCELCGKIAHTQCGHCRVTYYCSDEHQNADWEGIHAKICDMLPTLRRPAQILGSEEERHRRSEQLRQLQVDLLATTKREGHRLLNEGLHERANPAALQSLKLAMALYGAGSIELVPSYLLLGEASIGMQRFKQAEEYLSLAKWAVLKTASCPDALKSQLHRNFGMLYAAQGKHTEALSQLAHDIYYASCAYGSTHVRTSGGFYHMGNVFVDLRQEERFAAMFDTVVEIWQKYLVAALNNQEGIEALDEAQTSEAILMLTRIREIRMTSFGARHIYTGEASFTLALLYHFLDENDTARVWAMGALDIYSAAVGEENPTSQQIATLLSSIDRAAAAAAAALAAQL